MVSSMEVTPCHEGRPFPGRMGLMAPPSSAPQLESGHLSQPPPLTQC